MRHLSLFVLLLLAGCGGKETGGPVERTRPLVATTCPPMTYIVKALVGEAADVVYPLPPDADPGHWQPTREAVQTFNEADLIVYNGAGYESWMVTVSLPRRKLVNTTAELSEPLIQLKEAVTHAHGGGKEHTHSSRDPRTWMDPLTLKEQAATALKALRKLLPKRDFTTAAKALDDELDNLHTGFENLGSQVVGRAFLASYPAYNYLARRYGWRMHNAYLDPTRALSGADLDELKKLLDTLPIDVLWWTDEPVAQNLSVLRDFELPSVVVRTGERVPEGKTYLELMWDNVESLRPVFQDP